MRDGSSSAAAASYTNTTIVGTEAGKALIDGTNNLLFGNLSGKNLNRPLCILLDGMAISAPNLQSVITTSGIITGNFSQQEVADMVNKLNAGSLPARLIEQPISVKTIGPSIGADNRDQGIKAGLIGLGPSPYPQVLGSLRDVIRITGRVYVA